MNNTRKFEALTSLMSAEVNEIKVPFYQGDLIHDGAFLILTCKEEKTFLWALKGNGCGTFIGVEPRGGETNHPITKEYLLRNEYPHVYRLKVEAIDSLGYPRGTIEILKGGSESLKRDQAWQAAWSGPVQVVCKNTLVE